MYHLIAFLNDEVLHGCSCLYGFIVVTKQGREKMENYSRELSALRPAGWCQVAQARESAHEYALQDPEQRSGVRLQGGAASRPRRPSGADPSLPFSAPTSGSPLGRCGAWASETLPSLRGARPAWAGTARAWSWSARVAPHPRLQGERPGRGEPHHRPPENEAHKLEARAKTPGDGEGRGSRIFSFLPWAPEFHSSSK